MATTINPTVSGTSYRRWLGHVGLFAMGVSIGAFLVFLASAAVLLTLAAIDPRLSVAAAATLIAIGVSRDLGLSSWVPYRDRTQVPEWLRKTVWPGFTALAYGSHLGLGFLTRFTYSTHLAFVVVLPFLTTFGGVLLAIGTYAAGKCIVILLSVAGRTYAEFEPRNLYRFRSRRYGWRALRLANAAIALLVAGALITNT